MIRAGLKAVPAIKYALGVGGIAAVVSISLVAWKLPPSTAILGVLVLIGFMVVLVIFAALAGMRPKALRPLALCLAWAFLILAIGVASLFVSCAFFDKPKSLPCLLQGQCGPPVHAMVKTISQRIPPPQIPQPARPPLETVLHSPMTVKEAGSKQSVDRKDQKVTQLMVNSPAGVQALGDVTILRDPPIIHSVVLHLWFDQTRESPVAEPQTDVGWQIAVGFLTPDQHLVRFVSNWQITDHQFELLTRRLSFVLEPETPTDILGKDIAEFAKFDMLAVNLAEIFRAEHFAQDTAPVRTGIAIFINGIEVVHEEGPFDSSGALVIGKSTYHLASTFAKIPQVFAAKTAR